MSAEPNYIVIRKRDDGPVEAYPFTDKSDAVGFYKKASSQWTDTYLCAVMVLVEK